MNIKLILASAAALLAGCASSPQGHATEGLARIEHIVVIYAENRSFDHLYGFFPVPTGSQARRPSRKLSSTTTATRCHTSLRCTTEASPAPSFPRAAERPVPHRRAAGEPPEWTRFFPARFMPITTAAEQIQRRQEQHFVAMSTAGAWVMGYFDGSKMKLWKWAQEYTLADHSSLARFGGSYLNHQWLGLRVHADGYWRACECETGSSG